MMRGFLILIALMAVLWMLDQYAFNGQYTAFLVQKSKSEAATLNYRVRRLIDENWLGR
jgi:hypothetical protein